MSKTCQYAMNDDKKFVGLTFVNVNMFKLVCKKKKLRRKNQGKGSKNGKMHALKMGCGIKS